MNAGRVFKNGDLENISNSEYHLLFLEDGNGTIYVESDKIFIEPGICICITPNSFCNWNEIRKVNGWIVSFQEEFLSLFFQNSFFIYRFQFFYSLDCPCYFKLSPDSLNKFLFTIRKMIEEIHLDKLDSPHALRAMLYFKLIQLNRYYANYYKIAEETEQKETVAFQFKMLLLENIPKKQRVEDYTRILKITRPHLNKICKKYFKVTPSQLIKSFIIKIIKKEILYSNKNLTEIAFEMNFSDLANFTRFFSKHTGISPSKYKETFFKNK